jgi:hypothetical protein
MREVSVYFFGKDKLTLLLTIGFGMIIKFVVYVHDFGNSVMRFLGDETLDCRQTDRLYEFRIRSSGMDPPASDLEIGTVFSKLVIAIQEII